MGRFVPDWAMFFVTVANMGDVSQTVVTNSFKKLRGKCFDVLHAQV